MLLIDALYINNGGGKVLLDILIERIHSSNVNVMYLLDERIAGEYRTMKLQNVTYLKPSLLRRDSYYRKNRSKIASVLAFANVPPTVKLACPTYTYFHNMLFLENTVRQGSIASLSLLIKKSVIQLLKRNTSKWIVQSEYVKTRLSDRWNIRPEHILVMPIFDDSMNAKISTSTAALNNGFQKFLYVSDGHPYKNHERLITAFSKYNELHPESSLTVTISESYPELKKNIEKLKDRGIKIIDKGIISRKLVNEEYRNASIVFYPSLYESFGLGLIEAARYGLPVSAADLPYVYEVIRPNAVFDPLSEESIFEQMCNTRDVVMQNPPPIVCKNRVDELISELTQASI